MYRWFIALMALYLAGDPELVYLKQLGTASELVLAFMLSLAVIPWVARQFDH